MADLAIIDRIVAYCEPSPDPSLTIDTSGKQPDEFRPNTLYAWTDQEDTIVNTETGPARQENFFVLVLFVADANDEEAQQERQAEVSNLLSSRRDAYLERLADRDSIDLWAHIEAEADMDWTTNFEGRAVAIRVTGYRFL